MIWRPRKKPRHIEPKRDPVEVMTIRVAHRICSIVYGGGGSCECKNMVNRFDACDNMKVAAQHAFKEIMGQD